MVYANIYKIREEKDEETSDTYDLKVFVCDEDYWPHIASGINFAMVQVKCDENPSFQQTRWTIGMGICHFSIPVEYENENLILFAYKLGWEQTRVEWMGQNEVDILMKDIGNSRTSNYPFKTGRNK